MNDNGNATLVIIGIVILLAAVGLGLYFLKNNNGGSPTTPPVPTPPDPTDPASLYQSTTSNGGFLAHMLSSDMAQQLISQEPFSIQANSPAICDCSFVPTLSATSQPYKGTCSAWSFMRQDLLPVTLNNPINDIEKDKPIQELTLTIGIMVNVEKMRKYISSMSVIDSDTDHRSCGENFFPESVGSIFACPGQTSGSLTIPGSNNSACPDIDCDPSSPSYEVCRRQNAGGGVNMTNYGCDFFNLSCKNGQPSDDMLSQWDCSSCTARGTTITPESLNRECPISTYPNVCVPQDPPAGVQKNPAAWSYQTIEQIPKGPNGQLQASNYVSPNSKAFGSLASITIADPTTGKKSTGLNDPYNVSILLCKYNHEDWDQWLEGIKQVYRAWYSNYSLNGKSLQTAWNPGTNYLMGCNPWVFLENEVNLYFRPYHAPEQQYNKQQDQDLQDAIIGFFYVGRTCLDMMQGLEGVECTIPNTTEKRVTAADRCEAYACPVDAPYSDQSTRSDCIKKYVTEEDKDIPRRKALAHTLCNMFNTTYNKNVNVYTYIGQTSAYMRYEDLKAVLYGNGVPFDNVFKKEPPQPSTTSFVMATGSGTTTTTSMKNWRDVRARAIPQWPSR